MGIEAALWVAGGISTIGGAFVVLKKLWLVFRKLNAFLDELVGEPAQFGRAAKPGVIERMDAQEALMKSMHHELHPNSGSSLRDAVDRTERTLNDHLKSCPPPVQVNVNTQEG